MNLTRAQPRITVRAHDPVLRSLIMERLAGLGDIAEDGERAPAGDAVVVATAADASLTPREVEVLGLLAEGMANKEIAARLSFSTHTAKFHVESLLRKLDAANRAEAVREGIRRGLIGV
ncbi:MAG TPA: LuxR C-terminal-related transcriptional regulator [Spirochaetia bacterium]|nr:LuxR C-terminal-related transcriptional regulator [Spirochaetia bacterium]